MVVTRTKPEELCMDLWIDTEHQTVLRDAGISVSEVDEVIGGWGMTKMPLIQRKTEEFFQRNLNRAVNPDEVA